MEYCGRLFQKPEPLIDLLLSVVARVSLALTNAWRSTVGVLRSGIRCTSNAYAWVGWRRSIDSIRHSSS
jgi:hypothetical protein